MPSRIELLHHEPVTYEEALNKSFNIVQRHEQLHAKNVFTAELWRQRDWLAEIARHHLHLNPGDAVTIYPQEKWLTGGFNMCVPVDVLSGTTTRRLLFKCPMPFKVAEANYPGSVDEKLRGEVGAYSWMQQNCPGIRIPHLYGFGSPSHQVRLITLVEFTNLLPCFNHIIVHALYCAALAPATFTDIAAMAFQHTSSYAASVQIFLPSNPYSNAIPLHAPGIHWPRDGSYSGKFLVQHGEPALSEETLSWHGQHHSRNGESTPSPDWFISLQQ